ncbi:MAG: DUF2330 domain-containing protein [Planctomycetes bacterium]|nr:DUF2330 domain-containing protein [Planctomycetota bacterium]MBL7186975.1 DUF2330 domain-containing protein [Phycisphaerae bacterium]
MATRRFFLMVFCFSILADAGVVLADGKVFIWRNKDADIYQPTQKAYIRWDGAEEKLLLQTKYEGPAEEMVWVVPVPSEPEVEKGDPNIFERLSKETMHPDIACTHFWRLSRGIAPAGNLGPRKVEKWRKRIGAYDVVLLSPVGAEDVIRWLNSNEFSVPDEAVPILRGYIRDQWWMVATRIHRDALTEVTREKLAEGTLHPLEFTFKSSKCIYPLKLTSLAAGPVEELIYVEGSIHFEPATLRRDWEIDIFGGPAWELPIQSPEEYEEYMEGKRDIQTLQPVRTNRHLTKLRRVFKPQDMTEDIIFAKLDYGKLCSSGVPLRIGQAATQYGRHRDANSVSLLLKSLSPGLLARFRPKAKDYEPRLDPSSGILSWQAISEQEDKCEHVRSCIWALGEIMLEHGLNPEVKQALLRCARHDSELVRLEAYAALTKLDCREIGPILLNRFRQIFEGDLTRLVPASPDIYNNDNNILVEAAVVAECVDVSGTARQKDTFVEMLSDVILRLPVESKRYVFWHGPNTSVLPWIVWSAAATRDPRLVRPLREYRAGFPEENRYQIDVLLRAEAACGSRDAISPLVRRTVNDQSSITDKMEAYARDLHESLQSSDRSSLVDNWRDKIRQKLESPGRDDKVLAHVHDTVIHTALSENELDEWYVLCLLGRIAQPQDQGRERIRVIWAKKNKPMRLAAIQVLWAWKDVETLLELREQCDEGYVKDEIQRALDSLGAS